MITEISGKIIQKECYEKIPRILTEHKPTGRRNLGRPKKHWKYQYKGAQYMEDEEEEEDILHNLFPKLEFDWNLSFSGSFPIAERRGQATF